MQTRGMRRFAPHRLGRLECDAWVSYYRHEWGRFLAAAVGMVREGFGMPWPQTLAGAVLVLRANQLWAPVPDNDPGGAQTAMRRFYALLARTTGERFDVDEAARLEIAWWREHRRVQRVDRGGDTTGLVEALTALTAHVYRCAPDAVRPAAQLRADAMSVSDRWVDEGCDAASPLLADELRLLVESYASLLDAVSPAR